MELLKNYSGTVQSREQLIIDAEATGANLIRSGSPLVKGTYTLVTPAEAEMFATKIIQSSKNGMQYVLLLIAGTVINADETKIFEFGIGDKDLQMVVPLEVFNAVEPNKAYTMNVNDKGRVDGVKLKVEAETTELLETPKPTAISNEMLATMNLNDLKLLAQKNNISISLADSLSIPKTLAILAKNEVYA